MEWPRITVITPSYNQGAFIEQTIRSVVEQGYPNLEYVICDGGSTDNSVEVIRRYERQIAWWVSEKDKGQSHAINKGFAKASGELFAYINSDDTLMPGSLAAAAEAYRNGSQWITGWAMFLEPHGGQWPQLPRAMDRNIDWFISNPVCQQATFWAARFTRELGGFWEDMHYAFDYEFWMRLWFVAGVRPLMLRRCMGGFRMHEASKTVAQQEAFAPDFARVREAYWKYLAPGERRAVSDYRRHQEMLEHRHEAWAALMNKDVKSARRHACETFRRARWSADSWRLMYCALRGY